MITSQIFQSSDIQNRINVPIFTASYLHPIHFRGETINILRNTGNHIPIFVQTGPGAHPAFHTMGNGSFPGVKNGRGVTLNPHLLLVPWSRKGRATPLLPLWAVRPVQSLSACTRGALYLYIPLYLSVDERSSNLAHRSILL